MNVKDKLVIKQQQEIAYSGPLPPATEFAQYEQILNGAAQRILTLAEKEAEHRRIIENKMLKSVEIGQIFAFILIFLSLAVMAVGIIFNVPLATIPPAIVALSGLASAFIGKNSQIKESQIE
ncbi:MAG: DUF2335 domain-containing protein [Chitinivibrionia bacterium]|nr:DUF2335 domain-containing protein [Chitinivibrionia bacterium]